MIITPEYTKPKVLTKIPYLPRLHLAGGNGSPLIRLSSTQPIEIIYVLRSPSKETETTMLKANVLPKLMKLRRIQAALVA